MSSTGRPLAADARSGVNAARWVCERVEAGRVLVDEVLVDGTPPEQQVGHAVEHLEVALRREGVVLGRRHRRLGAPGVEHDDLGFVGVAGDALPHDRVGDGQVRADQDDDVGLLEVGVGVGRGVEAEGLLVGDHGRGHALAGVAVAVADAHAEATEGAEQRHLLRRHLAGGQERHRVGAVIGLHLLHARHERVEGDVPGHRFQRAAGTAPQHRRRRPVGRLHRRQRLPPLRAGHAEVHRVVHGGRDVHGLAVDQVHVERAPGRSSSRTPPTSCARERSGSAPAPARSPPAVRASSAVRGPS